MAGAIVAGGIFTVLTVISSSTSWSGASVEGVILGVAWGFGFRFWMSRRRKAGLLAEGTATDDPADTPVR